MKKNKMNIIFALIFFSLTLFAQFNGLKVDVPDDPRNTDITKIMFYIHSRTDTLVDTTSTSAFVKFDSILTNYPSSPVQQVYHLNFDTIDSPFTYHYFTCRFEDHARNLSPYSNFTRKDAQFPTAPILSQVYTAPPDTVYLIIKGEIQLIK